MSDVNKTGQGNSYSAALRQRTTRERAAGKCLIPQSSGSTYYSVHQPTIFQSRLPAFPSKARAARMEAQLRARKGLPKGAKIMWGVNFKTGKWEPEICDRNCQDPALQASLLRNATLKSKSKSSDSNWKRFGRAAAFAFAWPVTVPAALLGGCSDSPGDNNNNPPVDGAVDASDIGPVDAGDASPLDDGGVTPAGCIPDGRERYGDTYLKLVNPDNEGHCYARAMSYNELQDKITVLCTYPNNRLLQFTPGAAPVLAKIGRVSDSAPAPDNGETAEVHPSNVMVFSPDNSKQLAVVSYQQVNQIDPGNVKGGVILFDLETTPIHQVQDLGLSVRIVSGGDPEGTIFTYTGPLGLAFMQGNVSVAPRNENQDTGEPIVSDIVSVPVVDRGNGLWILEDDVSLGSPDGMGFRPSAVAKVNDTLLAGVFDGAAAPNSNDWERPKFSIFDATSDQTFNDALLTIDDVGLTHDWQFVSLPGVAKTSDNRSFVLAAENPSTERYKVISIHLDDLGDVANANDSVASFDLPAELANPVYEAGSDEPENIATGPVSSVVIKGARAYVTTAGDGEHHGFMFVFDINLSNGNLTPAGVGAVGIDPGPSLVAPGSAPGTKSVYQATKKANCEADPYVMEIEADDIAWGSM